MPEASTSQRTPRWVPILVGCGILFGALLLIGLGLTAFGFYWLISPGSQMPATAVVGPDSIGVIALDDASRDPGIRALASKAMIELQRAQAAAQRDKVPPALEWIQKWQMAQAGQGVETWLPREAMVSLEPSPDGDDARMVAAVNFRRFVRPMGLALGWAFRQDPKLKSTPYHGQQILVFPEGPAVCFADGTLLVARAPDALRATLDRTNHPVGEGHPLIEELRVFRGRWDLYGVLARPQEAQGFVETLVSLATSSPPPAPRGPDDSDEDTEPAAVIRGVERATFAVDAVTANEMRGALGLGFASAAAAEEARDGVESVLRQASDRAATSGLELTVTPSWDGEKLALEGRLTGLEGALERWAAALAARPAARPRPFP